MGLADDDDTTARCGEDAAPYVLGALDREDAERFERHVETCAACRAEVERLRPVVEALPAPTEPVAPPPELKRRVMAAVRRPRS